VLGVPVPLRLTAFVCGQSIRRAVTSVLPDESTDLLDVIIQALATLVLLELRVHRCA
jgi:hypothetical protein